MLRRRCQPLLAQLDLPHPFAIETMRAHLSARRGRPLHLHQLPGKAAAAGACGLWIATDTDDHIFYERRTARSHQEHIVLHEIGHMLLDHHSTTGSGLPGGLPGSLFNDLSPHLIHRILARANYSTLQEQEAEMLASLIRTGETGAGHREPLDTYGKLHAALGVSSDHEL